MGATTGDIVQVKRLAGVDDLRRRFGELGIELPVDDQVQPAPDGALAQPARIGALAVANRWCALPMEGWDATADGRPTELVARRWDRLGGGGAGLVWAEASAVRADGRANPRQLLATPDHGAGLAELRSGLVAAHHTAGGARATPPVVGLQLTHSGRWARPEDRPRPRTAYVHPLLDARVGATAADVLSDGELDDLVGDFVAAAVTVADAGFDFVDVKACHGYLGHELLSAVDRPGRYGGDLDGRTRFLRTIIDGVGAARPGFPVAVRLSAFDLVPHGAGPDRRGVPVDTGPYRYAFGGDGTGIGVDLTETHELLRALVGLGVRLVSVTAASPYYAPHAQRPAYFPPSDGYHPPVDPLVDTARLAAAARSITRAHPELAVVASGLSYLQDFLPAVAQAMVREEWCTLIGYGRMALSYPDLPADVLAGRPTDRRRICRTFSDCTTAPRAGTVSGCYPLDPFYKARPERSVLVEAKRAVRTATVAGES